LVKIRVQVVVQGGTHDSAATIPVRSHCGSDVHQQSINLCKLDNITGFGVVME
jgi:hypothetical protein